MELACPNCETQFFVADNAIAPNGRKVRCSVCEHVWEAKPAPAAKPAATPAPAAAAPPAKPAAPARPQPDDEFHWPAEAASESAPKKEPPPAAKPPEPEAKKPEPAAAKPTPAPAAQKPATPYASPLEAAIGPLPPERRSGSKRMILGVLLLIFVALTYGLRNTIVEILPKAAPLYELAGIPVGTQQSQLSITGVRFDAVDVDGTAMIRVSGLVANGGSSAATVGMLEVTLIDKSGNRAATKQFDPQLANIKPGQPARFQYDIKGEASTIDRAEVSLVPSGK
jgi:predicted Zn finger-like uncharacterized protein